MATWLYWIQELLKTTLIVSLKYFLVSVLQIMRFSKKDDGVVAAATIKGEEEDASQQKLLE